MKKILSVFAFVALAVLLVALFSGDERKITNYPPNGTKIVAFGDSLVEGVGATAGNDLFSLLEKEIGREIENYGRGGDTTGMALERLPQVLEEVPDLAVVIVLLGGNDFLRKVPPEETFRNLSKIISSFQDRGAVVLVLGIRGGLLKDNFEKDFEKLSETHGAAYVSNVLKGLVTDRKYMFDSIHPNDAGYREIAKRVAPVLKKLLN